MKEMKRILSLVLCFVMLVGLIPAGALSVWAEEGEDPVVVVADSDFQQDAGHEASDSGEAGLFDANDHVEESTQTTEPAPTEPAPTETTPTEPTPTEPAPTEPAPTEPAPTEPAPTEPAPAEPVASDRFSTYDVAQLAEGDDENQAETTGNDFPSYPEGGSVLVNKTGEGQDFQNTGVARVNLSTSGLPSTKGSDVIVMLDTSSSMNSNKIGNQSRLEVMKSSLKDLVAALKQPVNGVTPDIKIAVTDFNGYYTSDRNSPYYTDVGSNANGDVIGTAGSNTGNAGKPKVYTGFNGYVDASGHLTAQAFVDITTITDTQFNNISYSSGTNYDYAFDAIYQLGTAIKAQNAANGEDRDLFVIFMSDGAPYQFNYYSADSDTTQWNNWLNGTYANADAVKNDARCDDHVYYYNGTGTGTGQPQRFAEAIKGSPDQQYTVVRKNTTDLAGVMTKLSQDNLYTVPGLGATMFSIGFCLSKDDNAIQTTTMHNLLKTISSDPDKYYYQAESGVDLSKAFGEIATAVRYAAQNAYFVDQMGDAYDLQMNPNIVDSSDNTRTDISTDITVTSYPVYTEAQIGTTVDGHRVAAEDVGKTYGAGTVMETVVFTSDTAATSSALTDANIIKDGVICAKYFWYNTTNSAKTITLADGSSYNLPAETFYWDIGLINEKQFTLSYAVYLTGSMEGTRAEGSYDTNNYATLHYTNWLDHDVEQSVKSPTLPWGGANVSYAFYLVNSEGQPVDANGNVVPNIVTAYKVTRPVLYKTVNLNSGETVLSTEADAVLPVGYTLYDADAVYTVTVNSGNGGGGWTIAGNHPASTYVTDYAGENEYSNATPVNDDTYDYTHTTVYFAVVWSIGTVPDSVVIDFGLPVDISVLANDMFGNDGTLIGVGKTEATIGTSYIGKYGTAAVNGSKVRYTPNTTAMDSYEQFTYAVNYTGSANPGTYYGTVTVIPATTIYYEDSFVKFDNLTWQQTEGGESWEGEWAVDMEANGSIWTQAGTTVSGATQAEDRPDFYSLTDANNIYGYDAVYSNCSTYSLGSAMKATVDYNNGAQASFTFYGTGFDVVSMTNNTTGTIVVNVYATNANGTRGNLAATMTVDTYYGYKQGDCHVVYTWRDSEWIMTDVMHLKTSCAEKCEARIKTALPETGTEGQEVHMIANAWIKDADADNTLWQVPVAEIEGLPYGKYEAVIQAIYDPTLDHVGGSLTGTYDFYLDAIRIYDPANDGASDGFADTTIEDAYKADGEGWPSYLELRNKLIDAETLGNASTETAINGMVFIDGDAEVGDAQISNYISYGPNNEVYLAPGQRVAFLLSTPANIKNVHIGIKSADGNAVTYTINNIAQATNSETGIEAGTSYNEKTDTISSTNDMYYDLTGWKGDIIVISNTGDDGIISLTNIKSTYTSAPADAETYVFMTPAAATMTLRSLNIVAEEDVAEEDVPEVTEPETTAPEETEPETTVPEETEPETTQPAHGSGSIGGVWNLIKKLIGWIWG